MKFNFRYSGNFCVASRESPIPCKPGQFFSINDLSYSVAKKDDCTVRFITKKNSRLDGFDEGTYSFVGPLGSGFSNAGAKRALVVAGGTGIGAALYLLDSRSQDLESHLIFYSKEEKPLVGICKALEINPPINSIVEWNTAVSGRPAGPLDPFVKREHSYYDLHVFVIGPKSLVESCREQCKKLSIPAENFHLNF